MDIVDCAWAKSEFSDSTICYETSEKVLHMEPYDPIKNMCNNWRAPRGLVIIKKNIAYLFILFNLF